MAWLREIGVCECEGSMPICLLDLKSKLAHAKPSQACLHVVRAASIAPRPPSSNLQPAPKAERVNENIEAPFQAQRPSTKL